MRLKKRLVLLEEFQAGVSSSNNKTASPVSKSVDTVETTPTATKSSAEARAEVINDVDAILTNLEKLSAQIAEDIFNEWSSKIDEEINKLNEDGTAINEAEGNFFERMLAKIKALKNFAVLKSTYPANQQAVMDAEVEKTAKLAEYAQTEQVEKEKAIAKLKEMWEGKLAKAREQFKDNPPKKQAALKKLREMRDDSIKDAETGAIKKRFDAGKTELTKKLDFEISKLKQDVNDLIAEFPIEGADTLKKEWEVQKQQIDHDLEINRDQRQLDAEVKYLEDPDKKEKELEKAQEHAKKLKEAAQAEAAELQQDLKASEDKMAALEAEEMNDPKKKEAVIALKEYFKSSQEYLAVLGAAPAEDMTDEDKKTIVNARKKFNAAKGAVTPTKLKNAGYAADTEEAEELMTSLQGSIDAALKEFNDKIKAADTAAKEAISAVQSKIEAAEAEISGLEGDVQAADGDAKKEAKKALINKKIEIQGFKKEKATLEEKPVEAFDAKIAELQQELADVDNQTSEPAREAQSAEQVAQAELGDEFSNYTKVENPDEEETVTNDAGEEVTRKKWMNAKTFKGKDAEGNDTEETAIYALPNTGESAPVANGSNVSESFGFQTASVADKFRMLM